MTGILLAAVGNSYGAKPLNTVAPAVTGTAQVRQTLSCSTGTWTAAPPSITYTYQWKANGSPISGATNSTYTIAVAYFGQSISCDVTATNIVGSTTASSNSTAAVAANVPAAPTIGTATATGSSTATVSYTAPADNGGATITSYTAVSNPGGLTGTLSTSGSGTITVSGLTPATSYTFRVYATNSVGNSAQSNASNSITTQQAYWISQTSSYGPSDIGITGFGSDAVVHSQGSGGAWVRMYRVNGSNGSIVYSKDYGSSNMESRYRYISSNGSTVFAGLYNYSFSPYRAILLGVNSSGDPSYVVGTYDGSARGDASYYSTAVDSSSNIYVSAIPYIPGSDRSSGVAKYNSSGTLQWYKKLTGLSLAYQPTGVATNGTIVAQSGRGADYCYTLCVTVGGASQFVREYRSGSGQTGALNCAIDNSSNVYQGLTANRGDGSFPHTIAKVNSSGTLQWSLYNNSVNEGNGYIHFATDGFLYIVGQAAFIGSASWRTLGITKMDTNGSVQWTRRLYRNDGTTVSASSASITVVGSNMFIAMGTPSSTAVFKLPTDGSRTGTYGIWTYDTSGPGWSGGSVTTSAPYTIVDVDNVATWSPSVPSANAGVTTTVTNW